MLEIDLKSLINDKYKYMLFQSNNKAPRRQVGVLLDYIGTKRPVDAYYKLRNALIQTGQKHVVDKFLPELSEFNRNKQ